MKGHKGNKSFGDISSKNNKNGSMQPEKHTEQGKGSMQQPGKGYMNNQNKDMNSDKGFKQNREEVEDKERTEHGKSKYFGNYKKTCTDKCCNCNKTNCTCE